MGVTANFYSDTTLSVDDPQMHRRSQRATRSGGSLHGQCFDIERMSAARWLSQRAPPPILIRGRVHVVIDGGTVARVCKIAMPLPLYPTHFCPKTHDRARSAIDGGTVARVCKIAMPLPLPLALSHFWDFPTREKITTGSSPDVRVCKIA